MALGRSDGAVSPCREPESLQRFAVKLKDDRFRLVDETERRRVFEIRLVGVFEKARVFRQLVAPEAFVGDVPRELMRIGCTNAVLVA